MVALVLVVIAGAIGIVVVTRNGPTPAVGTGTGTSSASGAWTLSGAINTTANLDGQHKCPDELVLLASSGTRYNLTIGGPVRDGTVSVTDPAAQLLAVSTVDLTRYWFSIDTIGAYQGVGQGASGTITRSGNTYSVDATLVPWTRVAAQTQGTLHIKGSVNC